MEYKGKQQQPKKRQQHPNNPQLSQRLFTNLKYKVLYNIKISKPII